MSNPSPPVPEGRALPPAPLRWQERRAMLVSLTAAAGWLDALAWLYLGKVFVSFMSGNLLFLGIAAGHGTGAPLARAAIAIAAFLIGTTVGARIAGSQLVLVPVARTLLLEAVLLGAFAVVWAAGGDPVGNATLALVLIAIAGTAMGLQAAAAIAFHIPNVATVAMTATLAQLGALLGWWRREGRSPIVDRTPPVSLMVPLTLAYVLTAIGVALVSKSAAMAFGPMVLVVVAVAIDVRPAVT